MELPLTPSARPRRAPRRSSGAPVAEAPEALTGRLLPGRRRLRDEPYITGRRRLRDEPPYGTSLLTGRRRWDEPPYGPEAEALTGRASLRDGVLNTGGAYGTSLLTGRRRLRDEPPYGRRRFRDPYGTSLLALRHSRTSFLTLTGRVPHGPEALPGRALTEALTGRASLRAGGAYGTSLFTGRNYEPPNGTAPYRATPAGSEGVTGPASLRDPTAFTGRPIILDEIASLQRRRRRLRDEPRAGGAYGTSLLTGRRCWDEPRYGTDAEALAGLASLHNGGADGTSLLTGRRGPFTEGPDGPELPTSLRPRLRPEAYGTSGSEALRGGSLRGGLTGRASGRAGGGGLRDAALGRAFLRAGALIAGGACGTSLLTGRRRLRGTGLARRHSQTSLRTEAHFYGPEALTGRLLTGRKRLRDEPHYGGGGLRDGTEALGGSLRARGGGAYGTSLLTYGAEALTGRASLRTVALTGRASLYTGRPSLR